MFEYSLLYYYRDLEKKIVTNERLINNSDTYSSSKFQNFRLKREISCELINVLKSLLITRTTSKNNSPINRIRNVPTLNSPFYLRTIFWSVHVNKFEIDAAPILTARSSFVFTCVRTPFWRNCVRHDLTRHVPRLRRSYLNRGRYRREHVHFI